MKKIFSILACLIVAISSYGQSNFVPGYIITNESDTLRGLVDFKSDVVNATICKFKTHENSNEQTFYPADIKGYRFDNEGKFYVSKSITLGEQEKTIFLEYLIHGVVDLYYYKESIDNQTEDNKKNEYFFVTDKDGELVTLSRNKTEIVGQKYSIVEDDKYKGILSYTLNKPTTMSKDIFNTSFNRKSMIKTIKKYHAETCEPGEECIEFENNYNKNYLKLNVVAYVGLQFSSYKYRRIDAPNSHYTSPELGVQAILSSPRYSKSLALIVDLSVSKLKESGSEYYYRLKYSPFSYSATLLSPKLIIQYTYPKGRFRPSAGIGFGFFWLLNKTSDVAKFEDIYMHETPVDLLKGFNFNIGFDYNIVKEQYLTFRLNYQEASANPPLMRLKERDAANIFNIRLGYKF